MKKPKYADLASLPEDARIGVIGRAAEGGKRVAFIVDDDKAADRYIEKLTKRFNVEIAQRMPGPVKNTVSVIVVKKEMVH